MPNPNDNELENYRARKGIEPGSEIVVEHVDISKPQDRIKHLMTLAEPLTDEEMRELILKLQKALCNR
jgi:hypothetical protein